MESISERLSEYYLNYDWEALPPEVLEKTKEVVLDYLGCVIGGSKIESTEIVKKALVRKPCPAESRVVGDIKVPCETAAFINGVASHGLEMDDMSSASGGHPAVVILPAALAAAELLDAPGRELLMAVIWGYDMMTRVGSGAVPDNEFARGWHPTATNGIFGATVAVAYLMHLDAKQTANALGIAGGFSSGNLECYADGSLTKRINPGNAAHGAIVACRLAAQGYTGPRWIFEGRSGFLKSHTDEPQPENMLKHMDYTWFPIMLASFKPYANCRYNHSPIDALLKLMKDNAISYKDIEEIKVDVVGGALRAVAEPAAIKYDPPNVVGAQFSLPYSISVAAIRGRAFIEEYTEAMLHDPEVRAMMPKVKIMHTGKMDAFLPTYFASEVCVRLKDGSEKTQFVQYCKGDPENPMSKEELADKFRSLARLAVSDENKIESIIELVSELENRNSTELCALL